MPSEGYTVTTVSDELVEKLTAVMIEYDCETLTEAVEITSDIALERYEAKLAEISADKLKNL